MIHPCTLTQARVKNNSFLNFIIRKAKREGRVHWCKIRKDVNSIQMTKDGEFHDITHKFDLIKLGIDVE